MGEEILHFNQIPSLPDDLIPSFDRPVIKDVAGLETTHLNYWLVMNEVVLKSNPRSLKVLPNIGGPEPSDLVRATFELSREDIKFLRKKVQSQFDRILKEDRNETKQLHLSTFVLTRAYTSASMMKARGGDGSKKVYFSVLRGFEEPITRPSNPKQLFWPDFGWEEPKKVDIASVA
ncbi:5-AROMATIC ACYLTRANSFERASE putative-RELATED [Salix purpurea]|uniref:5-AROMATIC ACYLTRANSFERASE putative-RELATED n=1 Tax=Salix purpurea TaxID=77065 RepID=A0A9Q0Z1G7_SALPP|nr:5-AROMATIC ACYLTRANSFERASE putative-RELATED [Salix purpurea]